MYLISDNVDTMTGMRLAGVLGEVVHTRDAFFSCIDEVLKKDDIAILVITEKAVELAPEVVNNIVKNRRLPLVVVIPDRHGSSNKEALNKNFFTSLITRES